MAALAILSIAMVVLIRSQTESLNIVRNLDNYSRAVYITENQLHWTFIDLNEADSWEEYRQTQGEDGDYDWQVILEPVEMQAATDTRAVMLKVVATTSWQVGRHRDEFRLETWYLWGQEQ